MEFEDLSDEMKGVARAVVKHNSSSIVSDVADALVEANTEAEFRANVVSYMEALKAEVEEVWRAFGVG